MTVRLKIWRIYAALIFGIALSCETWGLAEHSETLMRMLLWKTFFLSP